LFVPAFLAALFAARSLLLLRPIIPTLLFVALYFSALERHRRDGRIWALASLPLLQVVWANVQALSMLGPALVACYAGAALLARALPLGSGRRFAAEHGPGVDPRGATWQLLAAFFLCGAACFATPYGARAVALPLALLARFVPTAGNVYSVNVAENVPPWLAEQLAPGQFGHLGVFLALSALSFAAAPRVRLSHLTMAVALAALALAGNRNVLLLYWLVTPIVALNAAPALVLARRRWSRRAALREQLAVRWAGRGALACALVVTLGLGAVAAARETSLGEPAPWRVPAESARVVASRPGAGAIFAADQYGGYLAWRLGAAHRPFIDTRLVLRTRQEFEEYLAVADEPRRFDAWEEGKDFQYVLLPVAYPDRYLPLIAHLYANGDWTLVYTDGTEALFERSELVAPGEASAWDLSSPGVTDRILEDLKRRFGAAPQLHQSARAQLATLALAVGAPGEAERALAGLETPLADALRARCRLAAGDLDGAERLAARALATGTAEPRGLDALAVVAARRGNFPEALELLRRALESNPHDDEALSVLGRLEGQ
jgi:hypothetical protein